jgi:hypothetical protein
MKKLPIGISNLREIIQEGYAYVDKSELVYQLAESGKYYLTVEHEFRVAGKMFYKLRYPNMEVKSSLSDYILKRYSP